MSWASGTFCGRALREVCFIQISVDSPKGWLGPVLKQSMREC